MRTSIKLRDDTVGGDAVRISGGTVILKFHGGAQEVGRSSILLKDERSIMMDFGVKLDGKTEYPIDVPKVDAFILSHAHLDHSGYAPALYEMSHVPTFGTKPTLELSTLLLEDSLSIARKEHFKPPFHRRQLNLLRNSFVDLNYHKPVKFGKFDIELHDAGHISGSAITLIERANAKENRRIVYTGDFKLEPQTLHRGAEIVKSDVLITEATYAGREHPERNKEIARLIDEVEEVLDRGGNALIPVFAVGRAQEMLAILYQNGLAGSTYVDGMAREATKIVARNPRFIDNSSILSKAIEEAEFVQARERPSVLKGPSIILTTAGMLQGGPVLNYISRLNSNSRIFITGYQAEDTNGRSLVENGHINTEDGKVRIGTPVSVYDFSAHAGNTDLLRYVRGSAPNTVICVHSDEECAKAFVEEIRGEGFDAFAPKVGETIKLDG